MSISRSAEAMTSSRSSARPCSDFPPPSVARDLLVCRIRTRCAVAELPQPAHLGRLRRLDVRDVLDRLWFTGLIPDLATFRDRATQTWQKRIYAARARLARFGQALVPLRERVAAARRSLGAARVSVHTVVSSTSRSPSFRWHATISRRTSSPALSTPLRDGAHAPDSVAQDVRSRKHHHDASHREHGEVMLVTGMIVVYGYACEAFFGWYSGNGYERFMLINRTWKGPMRGAIGCCSSATSSSRAHVVEEVPPQLPVVFLVACSQVGMWLERFVIIVTSLHRDSCLRRGRCIPDDLDFMTFFGTIASSSRSCSSSCA